MGDGPAEEVGVGAENPPAEGEAGHREVHLQGQAHCPRGDEELSTGNVDLFRMQKYIISPTSDYCCFTLDN